MSQSAHTQSNQKSCAKIVHAKAPQQLHSTSGQSTEGYTIKLHRRLDAVKLLTSTAPTRLLPRTPCEPQ